MRNRALILVPVAAGAALLVWAMASDFVTFDETAHVGSAASYVATGDFRLNPEHPPLVKILAGLAMAPLRPSVPVSQPSWRDYNEWDFGRQFLFGNRTSPENLLAAARVPVVLLTLLLIATVTVVAFRWFGYFGAALTAIVATFDTTLLAHGHLVTTDVPSALTIWASVHTFVRFLERPTRRRFTLASLVFVAAQLTKYSALFLWFALPALAVARYAQLRAGKQANAWPKRTVTRAVAAFVLGTFLLTLAAYGFETRRPVDDPRIPRLYTEREAIVRRGTENVRPDLRRAVELTEPGTWTRRVADWVARTPIPGYPYWRGLFAIASHNASGHGSYLLGQTSSRGWWYYFPVAFAVKTPSGTLVLMALLLLVGIAAAVRIARRRSLRHWLTHVPLLGVAYVLVPIAYFAWSLSSHINLGVRHLLPVYPFLFVGIGSLARVAPSAPRLARAWRGTLLAIALTVPLTTLLDAPHFLSAFNTFAGGSKNGTRYLSDSNVDWGQDVKNLARALRVRGLTAPFVTYFTTAPVERYIPGSRLIPRDPDIQRTGVLPGIYAISYNVLYDPTQEVQWLRNFRPVFSVGNSAAVYVIKSVDVRS